MRTKFLYKMFFLFGFFFFNGPKTDFGLVCVGVGTRGPESVGLRGSGCVVLRGSGSVVLRGSESVVLCGSESVVLRGSECGRGWCLSVNIFWDLLYLFYFYHVKY